MEIRVIAIDWSGNQKVARKRIWLAESVRGELTRLEDGRDREELAAQLIKEAENHHHLVIGLDFAFSFPAWYCRHLGATTVHHLWERVRREGEDWLKTCSPPFWGRPGKKRSSDEPGFRKTEAEIAKLPERVQPKSVFQIGGAGAVGTGSIRGMPILRQLYRAGFSIWPFDSPGWPRVVEIYPRLLTGRVVKSKPEQRTEYLENTFPALSPSWRERAASSEDAFDAAVSAMVMAHRIHDLEQLGQASDPLDMREGRIWY